MSRHRLAFTRRGFCLCCTAAATVATRGWPGPAEAWAEAKTIVDQMRAAAADAEITVHRLRGNVAVLEGSGGNIAVLTGPDGKVFVDAGITASRPRILEAANTLGGEPIRHLINTHWHFDHADGNAWLAGEGAAILAHANTRKHLQSAQRVDDWDFDFPPSPPAAIPADVFSGDTARRFNHTDLVLTSYAPAHTDGDISVHFLEPDILHVGDTYWNGIYPFIDYSTGGGIDGMIAAADANLAAARETTIIIPGHGHPVSNRAELAAFREMLVATRDAVASLKRQGRSLPETVAAKPTAAFDGIWGQFVITPDFYTRLVYEGV
jgi:glyoxylase-like metal-dependent hydrolase (beta-lactamase superfamily II)